MAASEASSARPEERRVHPRLQIECPAAYRVLTRAELGATAPKTAGPRPAHIKNLGPGGVLLLSGEPLPERAVVSLSVSLPGQNTPIHSLAEVRHRSNWKNGSDYHYAAGLEFLSISSRDTTTIAQIFLRQNSN